MSEAETMDDLVKKNRQLKSRIQQAMKRPHPLKNNSRLHLDNLQSKPLVLDLEHHRTPKSFTDSINEPSRDYSYTNLEQENPKQKPFEYNSTLFRNIRDSDNYQSTFPNQNKTDDFFQNYSSASGISHFQSNRDHSQSYNIMDKIEEALANAKKGRIKQRVLDDHSFQKNLSSLSQESKISSNKDHEFKFTYQLPSARSSKLKTIEQQKQTLTIDREQQNKRRTLQQQKGNMAKMTKKLMKELAQESETPRKEESKKKRNPNLPPLANVSSTIERQKHKLQSTMMDLRRNQTHDQMDKQSIVLDLSDSENERDKSEDEQITEKINNLDEKQSKQGKQTKREKQKQERRLRLQRERQQLLAQLKEIDKRVYKINNFEGEQDY